MTASTSESFQASGTLPIWVRQITAATRRMAMKMAGRRHALRWWNKSNETNDLKVSLSIVTEMRMGCVIQKPPFLGIVSYCSPTIKPELAQLGEAVVK